MSARLTGSCACGQVRYEIGGRLRSPVSYCHCWRCRKQSGSSFGTTAGLDAGSLVFTAGKRLLRVWESSPGIHRYFASCCGSPIYKRDAATPEELGLRLGTLDADPLARIEMHFDIGSKAPWVEITDDLPQSPGGPPFGRRG